MFEVFWKSVLLAAAGTFILRLGGRQSISQLTIPQFSIMLSIGTILGSAVSGKGIFFSIFATAIFVGFLIFTEKIALKWDRAENLLLGRSVPVIENGELMIDNLRILRLSVDDLEKRLRLAGISSIADVKTGTIEVNGELGYELMPHARPVTIGDLEKFFNRKFPSSNAEDTIFSEIINGTDEGVPKQLQ